MNFITFAILLAIASAGFSRPIRGVFRKDVEPPLFSSGILIQAWEDNNTTLIRGPDDQPYDITLILPSNGEAGDVLTLTSVIGQGVDGSMFYTTEWKKPTCGRCTK